jgi:hypothetical protein
MVAKLKLKGIDGIRHQMVAPIGSCWVGLCLASSSRWYIPEDLVGWKVGAYAVHWMLPLVASGGGRRMAGGGFRGPRVAPAGRYY